jgi:methionyl aminopeptidase
LLEAEGARSAPEITYGFPGATCISIGPDVAHGVPGVRRVAPGDLINIDVSAELDGFFADTGASFAVPPVAPRIKQLCRDGRRALWRGIRAVRPGASLNAPGREIEAFARRNRYSLIKNLASHGVGAALHEEPKEIATWADHCDRRKISEGLVFTLEPFLSLGAASVAESGADGWSLAPQGGERTRAIRTHDHRHAPRPGGRHARLTRDDPLSPASAVQDGKNESFDALTRFAPTPNPSPLRARSRALGGEEFWSSPKKRMGPAQGLARDQRSPPPSARLRARSGEGLGVGAARGKRARESFRPDTVQNRSDTRSSGSSPEGVFLLAAARGPLTKIFRTYGSQNFGSPARGERFYMWQSTWARHDTSSVGEVFGADSRRRSLRPAHRGQRPSPIAL